MISWNFSYEVMIVFYIFNLEANLRKGKLGKEAYLDDWVSKFTSLSAEDHALFDVTFDWDESLGVPGALIIRNQHHSQFYLKTVTLEDVPGHGPVHFVCDSWVYPAHRYKHDRIFFTNKVFQASNQTSICIIFCSLKENANKMIVI